MSRLQIRDGPHGQLLANTIGQSRNGRPRHVRLDSDPHVDRGPDCRRPRSIVRHRHGPRCHALHDDGGPGAAGRVFRSPVCADRHGRSFRRPGVRDPRVFDFGDLSFRHGRQRHAARAFRHTRCGAGVGRVPDGGRRAGSESQGRGRLVTGDDGDILPHRRQQVLPHRASRHPQP